MRWIRAIYDWMGSKVGSPHADAWLAFLFFIESSVLLIPVDPLLILYCLAQRTRVYYYAFLTTVSSVAGGLFGYWIGAALWHTVGIVLVKWFISEWTFYQFVAKYKMYQHWVVLFAGFAPVPYKAVTVSAGFCNLPIIPFLICSTIARGARFYLIAWAIKRWGDTIAYIIDRYFNYLVILFVVLVGVSFLIFKH